MKIEIRDEHFYPMIYFINFYKNCKYLKMALSFEYDVILMFSFHAPIGVNYNPLFPQLFHYI